MIAEEDFPSERPEGGDALGTALRNLKSAEGLFVMDRRQTPSGIGGHRVVEKIGRGGAGIVVLAEPEGHPGEVVALKVLSEGALAGERALQRFRREAAALERLFHPGFVRVKEVSVAEGRPFLLMERVAGRSLARVIAAAASKRGSAHEGPCANLLDLPGTERGVRAAVSVLRDVARAVAAVHAEGILHRDIKPGNVIITGEGRPVLIDFGLVDDVDAPALTRTGDVVGTPA